MDLPRFCRQVVERNEQIINANVFYRYYALIPFSHWDPKTNPDTKQICKVILDTHVNDTNKYQIGLSKIFFRAGQVNDKC